MGATAYCFDRFTLDPIERRLCADGVPVPLGTTGFRILLALVENAGTLVSKDELITRVWGRSPIGDNALHVHITALRKVIGRNSIVTKQGRGYRFAARVQREQKPVQRIAPERPPGNLPSLWVSHAADGPARLIGRRDELREIAAILARSCLVTLTGPGGVGKTSLALHAAGASPQSFPDGVWLVELATLSDPDLVPGAVATVLGIEIGQSAAPLDTLARQLARKSLLILLDNCEHVLAMAAQLSEALLRAATDVKILATSREALRCIGEQIFEVPPLALPQEGPVLPQAARGTAAVELFIERTRSGGSKLDMTDEDLSTAVRICRRLDGLPLAIEMAAGWVGVLGLDALDAQLDGSLKAWLRARNTAPPRHSTLRATLEWGHGLLSPTEQVVLRRLAVFAGSFPMDAAIDVAGDDELTADQVFEGVANLIRKSMVAVVPGSQARRYRLLETTRGFALEKLDASGDTDATRRRHAEWMVRLIEIAMREWETTGDAVWLERYAPALDDLRTALDWATERDSDAAVALAGASWPLWWSLTLHREGQRRLGAAAGRIHSGTPQVLEARLRHGLGRFYFQTTALNRAYEELSSSVTLYRALGESPDAGTALVALGFALLMLGRISEAEQAIDEALSLLEHERWPRTLAKAYSVQMCIETRRGRFDAVRLAGEKALRLCDLAGAERSGLVLSANLVEATLEMGEVEGAVSEGRALAERLRDTRRSDVLGYVLSLLTAALTAKGDLDEALVAAREAAPLLRDHAMLFLLFDHLALRACLVGRNGDSALVAGYADALYRASRQPREPIGNRAVEQLNSLLRDALPEEGITQLRHEGATLNEDQALALALRG